MTPQKQTILSDKEKGTLGNCLTACIASLFDMKIEDVPYFVAFGEDWFKEFMRFMDTTKFEMQGTWTTFSKPDWAEEFKGVDGYAIVGGLTKRGTSHAVIYKNGQPYFDPHPSDDFLVKVEDIYLIERKENHIIYNQEQREQEEYDNLFKELSTSMVVFDKPIRSKPTPHSNIEYFESCKKGDDLLKKFGEGRHAVLQKLRALKYSKDNDHHKGGIKS